MMLAWPGSERYLTDGSIFLLRPKYSMDWPDNYWHTNNYDFNLPQNLHFATD